MIAFEDLPPLRRPVLIAAFEGWNDAGEAASDVISHLATAWDAEPVAALDPEDYYDFQVARPRVSSDSGTRRVVWPTTQVLLARPADLGRDVLLVDGIEPSFRWRTFTAELLDLATAAGVEQVICLGALLGESPHTRPLPVSVTADDAAARERHGAEAPTYEGPTGITGVLATTATVAGLDTVSLWVSVPHYAAATPSPKAALALVSRIEDVLRSPLPHGDLEEEARAWVRGVDEASADDPDVREYIASLEEAADTAELPEASGDAIAREFERYLRGRDGGTPKPGTEPDQP